MFEALISFYFVQGTSDQMILTPDSNMSPISKGHRLVMKLVSYLRPNRGGSQASESDMSRRRKLILIFMWPFEPWTNHVVYF